MKIGILSQLFSMTGFSSLFRPVFIFLVSGFLLLQSGAFLQAQDSVCENFDSFPTGNFTSLETALGNLSAASGHATIASNRYLSSPYCMRLVGLGAGTTSSATLTLSTPLTSKKILSFTGQRWTTTNPFAFTIHAVDAEGHETLAIDGASLTTGSTVMTQKMQGLIPVGTVKLIFRCEAPPNTGALLDDLTISGIPPQALSCVSETWPAMIRLEANGILRFSMNALPSSYSGMSVMVDMSSCDALDDIDSVSIYTGEEESVYTAPPNGSSTSTPGILASGPQQPSPLMIFPISGEKLDSTRLYYFWVSVKLKDTANMDHKVGARIISVSIDGETLADPNNVTARQRIGFAVTKANDTVHDGPIPQKVSKKFRIPGIVRAKNGDLVSVFDIRYDNYGDMQANIDTGCSRSTDNGRTWTPITVAMNYNPTGNPSYDYNSGYGVSDPSILVDEVNGTLWVAGLARHGLASSSANVEVDSDRTAQYVVAFSTDNGQTWGSVDPATGEFVRAKPKSINVDVKNKAWKSFFQGPGHGITMKKTINGVRPLVFPSQIWSAGGSLGTPQSTIIYSLDYGETWISPDKNKTGTLGIGASSSECVVTELSDGSLMLNARDENKSGRRKVFTSNDMGETWKAHPTNVDALPEPGSCQASQLAVENSGPIKRALFFSNPDKPAAPRARMTLKASFDEGASWPVNRQVLYDSRGSAGYSDICETGDNHIGVLYEGLVGDENLFFLRIPYDEFLPSLTVPEASQVIRVGAEGITGARLTVSCDSDWQAISSADWITISPNSGNGNGTITYNVARLEDPGERTGTITITTGGIQPIVVTIIQSGSDPILSVSPPSVTLPKNGGSAAFSVACNAPWAVTKTAEWVNITNTQGAAEGNGTASVTIQPNPLPTSRTGELSFTSYGTRQTATVIQRGQKRTWQEWRDDEIAGRESGSDKTGPNDSAAEDGIPNLLKYATGVDPLTPCGSIVVVSMVEDEGNTWMEIHYPVNPEATGIRHLVEVSEDLETWSTLGEVDAEGKTSAVFRDPAPVNKDGFTRRFLRLKVSLEPSPAP